MSQRVHIKIRLRWWQRLYCDFMDFIVVPIKHAAKRIREPAGGNRLDQTASSSAGREHATQEGLKQEDGLVEHP